MATAMKKTAAGKKLSDFKAQSQNANKHTQRGMSILESSMQDLGYVAPMTACADGEIIDGSARHETAANVFGSDVEPIVIESDGKRPIVVKRTDIKNAKTKLAKKISLAANRIAEVNLDWQPDVLADLLKDLDAEDLQKLALTDADLKAMDLLNDESAPAASMEIHGQFLVMITCADEAAQSEVLAKCLKENWSCKALSS